MKSRIAYTVLAVLNLVAFAIGAALLTGPVPLHYTASLTIDRLGSAWTLIAFPAVTALSAAAVWVARVTDKKRVYSIAAFVLMLVGLIFCCIGWGGFAVAACGGELGSKAVFPYMIAIVMPLALAVALFANYMPTIRMDSITGIHTLSEEAGQSVWHRSQCFGGIAFAAAGLTSAAACVLFSCVPALVPVFYVAAIYFGVSLAAALAALIVYSRKIYAKAVSDSAEEL